MKRFPRASAGVDEIVATAVSDHARSGPGMVVWWVTSVECASAIARLEREHVLDAEETDLALQQWWGHGLS